jgi:bifunctional enzyme CysN/CysC
MFLMQGLTPLPNAQRGLLRFFMGGSVDDGKSTLIGRLLHETDAVAEDELAALRRDSARFSASGQPLDFSLLVDGLEDEREQGITIDVAHRYFATANRAFVVADTPGHESYTRNTASGASNADLAIILIDARRGLLPQTRRHAVIAHLVGVRHFVLAVNKLDLVGWDRGVFDSIVDGFRDFTQSLKFASLTPVPLSALLGDNVSSRSANTPWYAGPTLLSHLETIEIEANRTVTPLRVLVQTVLRPDADTRLYAGIIASGSLRRGDPVQLAHSTLSCHVNRIVVAGEDREHAAAGASVALGLDRHLDVTRGDTLVGPEHRPQVTDQFEAHLIWMSEQPLLPGREYILKVGVRAVPASVTAVKFRLDIETLHHQPAHTLALNEIGVCDVATAAPVALDSFAEIRQTGCFILIDRYSNETVAAGTIDFALRRGMNVRQQVLTVAKNARATLKAQRPCVLWFTGLSGAGKSTIAILVESKLASRKRHTYLLDGDNIRHGLNKDIGFTDADRVENIRRVGEVAKLFVDAGIIVLCSFISPFRAERAAIREMLDPGEFIEIHVSTPLPVCEARDPKGLYAKARAGMLPSFTGIDSPYEPPQNPDLVLDSTVTELDELAERVVDLLAARGMIGSDKGD